MEVLSYLMIETFQHLSYIKKMEWSVVPLQNMHIRYFKYLGHFINYHSFCLL